MKVSVVVPAYNEEKLIGQCLDALNNQTFPRKDFEIIVVDNNSTDKTAEIAKNHGARVVPYKEHQGFTFTKQYGSYQAKGEIIAYTDADSQPERNWLENLVQIFDEKENVQILGGTVLVFGNKPFVNGLMQFYDYFAYILQVVGIPLIWGPNMSVRKKAFEAVGGINLKLATSDDWDFVMRIQKKFGLKSALYSRKLRVRTSPRKQESLRALVPYTIVGIFNFFSIFVFRQSITFGTPVTIR